MTAAVVKETSSPAGGRRSQAKPFANMALPLLRQGWAPYPQTADDRRRPGVHNHQGIKWVTEEKLPEELPAETTVAAWARSNPGLNVAVAFGPGSGHAVGIDIDVTDPNKADDIVQLATEVLGHTPLRRVGKAPKVLLIYQQDPDEPLRNISLKFEPDDPNAVKSDQGLDILAQGKSATFYGIHHDTGRPFRWLESDPLRSQPSDLPVITNTQVLQWLEVVGARYTFHDNAGVASHDVNIDWDTVDTSQIRPPRIQASAQNAWVEDEDGYVVDGREQYLYQLARVTVRLYPDADISALARHVYEHFAETILNPDNVSRWQGARLRREVKDRVTRFKTQIDNGQLKPLPRRKPVENNVRNLTRAPAPSDGKRPKDLEFLPPADARRKIPGQIETGGTRQPEPDADDHNDTREQVSAEIDECLREFFDEVYPYWAESEILECPHGASMVDAATGEVYTLGKNATLPTLSGIIQFPESNAIDGGQLHVRLTDSADRRHDGVVTMERTLAPPYIQVRASGPISVSGQASGEDDGTAEITLSVTEPEAPAPRVHVLKAPTGAGKTTRTLEWIAKDPRRDREYPYRDNKGNTRYGKRPLLFLLPTYENIDELRGKADILNLDPEAPDEELAAEARRAGMVRSDNLENEITGIRQKAASAGLSTMVYSGKLMAGCRRPNEVQLAQQAGIGSSALCKVEKKDENGDKQPIFCDYYEGCPAIEQRRQIAESDIVFLPHNFMQLQIPEELKTVRAVICDERIHHLFLHTATLHQNTLMTDRPRPRPTKREREAGVTAEELEQDRTWLVDRVFTAFAERNCPAQQILEDARAIERDPLNVVKSAMRVCSSSLQWDGSVTPDITEDELREICNRPQGTELREEYRFWSIIRERIEALQTDAVRDAAIARLEQRLENANDDVRVSIESELERLRAQPDKAKGPHDVRIQEIVDEEDGQAVNLIRLSWRTEPNWSDKPLLLLDASAAPEILRKIWREREVREHHITAPMRLRTVAIPDATYSNSSIVASMDASFRRQAKSARLLSRIRQTIASISSLFADGRVLIGSSIIVRRGINTNWRSPDNVDFTHFGALRGLDFARDHKAAISVGRMEVPYRTIDGLAAALTYDDPEPEMPFDRRGDGCNEDGESLMLPTEERSFQLRNGYIFKTQVPRYPTYWARILQDQYREQELLQFVGRLRPVYREHPPIWFALTSVLPENIVLDDVISLSDVLRAGPGDPLLAEGIRRLNGVVDKRLIADVARDLFDDEEAVGRAMRRAGFKTPENEKTWNAQITNERLNHGFIRCLWQTEDEKGRPKTAFVAAFKDAPEEVLREQIARHEDIPAEKIKITVANEHKPIPGMPRGQDRIDQEIQEAPGRDEAEETVQREAAELMSQLSDKRIGTSKPYYYPVSENGDDPIYLTPLAIDAKQSLKMMWAWLYDQDPDETSVRSDGRDVYEHLGETTDDSDPLEDAPF